ncbi:hypothetical protein FHS29_002681 [Saccharothrix tamanrassetensis]|uniref:Uncharacterized protein n=1 Tax=Saccharothrix tamanrassetensis TaxID=1051531 RepID=A0A841CJA6_9PSEU|nr:hypothetical protein [Saccharothrix tamanrassetensis]MBB5956095.1 hypothetical protein [Saccharothrix tamanrassetensis]
MSGVVGVLLLLVAGFAAFAAVSLWRRSWPETPAFARPRPSVPSGELRVDPNAGFFVDRGFLFRERHFFVATGCPPVRIADYPSLDVRRRGQPVRIARVGLRSWWWFEESFYRESAGLRDVDVLHLVRDRERRDQAKQERARLLSEVDANLRKRDPE